MNGKRYTFRVDLTTVPMSANFGCRGLLLSWKTCLSRAYVADSLELVSIMDLRRGIAAELSRFAAAFALGVKAFT